MIIVSTLLFEFSDNWTNLMTYMERRFNGLVELPFHHVHLDFGPEAQALLIWTNFNPSMDN